MTNKTTNEWLLRHVEARTESIAPSLFFQLEQTAYPSDIASWVHQLPHLSRGFIQALALRVATCGHEDPEEYAYYRPFTRHLRAEVSHPLDLEDWMRHFYFIGVHGGEFCGVPQTAATGRLVRHCQDVADSAPADEQVVSLNAVGETVAFRFFAAARQAVARLGMDWGRFWSDHEDDEAHARMGMAEVGEVEPRSDRGVRLISAANTTLYLFDRALTSWSEHDATSASAGRAIHCGATESEGV